MLINVISTYFLLCVVLITV